MSPDNKYATRSPSKLNREPLDVSAIVSDRLLNTRELCGYLGVSYPTVTRWRTEGIGPAFVTLGKRRVAYRLSAVNAWLANREGTSVNAA